LGPGFPLQSFLRLLRTAKKDFRFNPLRKRIRRVKYAQRI
jgi:hypothetical protein